MIKVLLITIAFFVLLLIESFLLKVFSFSLFIIIVISMWKRVNDFSLYIFVTLFSIVLDSVLHTPLGTHGIVICVLLLLIESLWLLIPRDTKFGYVPVFIFVFLYYILVSTASSLLLDNVFPSFSLDSLIGIFVKSLVSVGVYILIERFTKSLRSDQVRGVIRLS